MKKFIIFFFTASVFAQVNTEVHLFDISKNGDSWVVSNGKNISNNPGYDNQPYFYDDTMLLFSSTRNGQTDIATFNIETGALSYISNTPNGGEYSPQRIPNSKNVSAVRLDKDGLQRFYRYNFKTGKDKEIIKDLKVAYPAWVDKNTVVAVSIVNDSLELIISNLKTKKNLSVAKMVGRSVHKIPNSNLISFISKNEEYWDVNSLDIKTKEIKKITSIGASQDICWLPDGTLLIPDRKSIYKFHPEKDTRWTLFHTFTDDEINNLSRITVNKNGTQLAIVAEESPEHIVQKQLDAYNKRDIDAFLATYTKNVKVYRYPNKLDYEGVEKMRTRYEPFFKNTPDLNCKILSRIVKDNKVIDHEFITSNGRNFKAVAIYEVTNGKISSVTFL